MQPLPALRWISQITRQKDTMKYSESQEFAKLNVAKYLKAAVMSIDEEFGKGYAVANPVLIGAFIQACAVDVLANILQDDVGAPLNEIAEPLRDIAVAIANHE